jgi:adenylate cyclase
VQYANRRGISDEELAAASKEQGDLLDVFEELAPGDLTPVDQRSAARQAGVPEQLRLEVAELLGLENPDEGTQADADALALLGPALQLGLPAEAMSQLVRVYVELLERLADAENRIFHDHVHEQFRAAGLSGRALLEATNAVAKPALELVESAVLYFHRRGWDKASRDDFLRHLAEATTPPQPHPGEHTAAVMFVDLAGFTPLTLAIGDHGVADMLRRFSAIVRGRALAHGGRIVKQIGDAFMLVFDHPDDAVVFGLDALREAAEHSDVPDLHIGAHWGATLYREGDYYGSGVNLAARVASATEPGQFLVTGALHDAAPDVPDVAFRELPPRLVKGVAEPVTVCEVRPVSGH